MKTVIGLKLWVLVTGLLALGMIAAPVLPQPTVLQADGESKPNPGG